MRILVVEDDPVLLDGLKAGLGLVGATVDAVSCCADGLAALATTSFDAVVLDLHASMLRALHRAVRRLRRIGVCVLMEAALIHRKFRFGHVAPPRLSAGLVCKCAHRPAPSFS